MVVKRVVEARVASGNINAQVVDTGHTSGTATVEIHATARTVITVESLETMLSEIKAIVAEEHNAGREVGDGSQG